MSALPAAAPDEAPVERRAARVLLVDADDRVLLFHGCDPHDPGAGRWWFTPGGGLDPGESPAQAAARELAEETGLVVHPEQLGAPVHARTASFRFAGGSYRQSEEFFLLRVVAHEVDSAGFSALELAAVLGHRWWPRDELRSTDQRVYPVELPDVLDRIA
jgi:8-oxo-dGTP pyrophosphatase MutT (NUDIX family)